jgi:hypothetical protein
MEGKWQRKRILIWGKTRPELSKKYREVVCTGGVFQDSKKLVRIYPIPLRFIDEDHVFSKYQWIEADVTKSLSDPRPESYKISYESIEVKEKINTSNTGWKERAKWILDKQNIFRSVEDIQVQQNSYKTSLGLIKPLNVTDVYVEKHDEQKQEEFWSNYKEALRQMELPIDPESGKGIRPIAPPDFKYKAKFRCNDDSCLKDHKFSILDWELDALYSKLRQGGDTKFEASQKVVEKIKNEVCSSDKDLYFFIGNISTHPHIFTIVGLWYPKKSILDNFSAQPSLF